MIGLKGKCLGLTCIFHLSQLRAVFCMMEQLIIPFSLALLHTVSQVCLKVASIKTYFVKTNSNAKPVVHD
jgi:hypothetical protein